MIVVNNCCSNITPPKKNYFNVGLKVSLVPSLSSDFGIGPHTFFCLTLAPALCKNIGIDTFVNFLLKKQKTNGVPSCPIISRHVAPIPIFLQSAGTNTNIFTKCRDQYQKC